jgi:ornithine carbamoyltransferase
MCHTEVTIAGETLEMWLPVMDGANKSMKKEPYTYQTRFGEKTVEGATTFDINKTIMRCLVKNLAMFGMGIYIYAGEDLPETESVTTVASKPTEANAASIDVANVTDLKKGTENWDNVVKYVTANKQLGIEKIGQQLSRKYKISPALKKEIANLISQ